MVNTMYKRIDDDAANERDRRKNINRLDRSRWVADGCEETG